MSHMPSSFQCPTLPYGPFVIQPSHTSFCSSVPRVVDLNTSLASPEFNWSTVRMECRSLVIQEVNSCIIWSPWLRMRTKRVIQAFSECGKHASLFSVNIVRRCCSITHFLWGSVLYFRSQPAFVVLPLPCAILHDLTFVCGIWSRWEHQSALGKLIRFQWSSIPLTFTVLV